MASNPIPLIFVDQIAAAAAGHRIGNGEQMRLASAQGGAKPNQDGFSWYIKVYASLTDTATGGSATVQLQDSPDNVTYTTRATFTLTTPAAAPFNAALMNGNGTLFKTTKRYFRVNVSVMSGGAAPVLNSWGTVGGYGA